MPSAPANPSRKGSMDAVKSVFVDWLQTDEVVMVLVDHQRKDITGCICGWAELGQMHPRHVLEKLIELLKRDEKR